MIVPADLAKRAKIPREAEYPPEILINNANKLRSWQGISTQI